MQHDRQQTGWYIVWMIGLLLLAAVSYSLEAGAERAAEAAFNPLPRLWAEAGIPFLFGMYLSLLFVKIQGIRPNTGLLLCVTLPCAVIAFSGPAAYMVTSWVTDTGAASVPVPLWLLRLNAFGIVPLVCGLSLIVGLFSGKRNQEQEIVR